MEFLHEHYPIQKSPSVYSSSPHNHLKYEDGGLEKGESVKRLLWKALLRMAHLGLNVFLALVKD